MIELLYQCAPIGVDRAPEAVAFYAFCSQACRDQFDRSDAPAGTTWQNGTDADQECTILELDHQCDTCGKGLTPSV